MTADPLPLSRPDLTGAEREGVLRVLHGNTLALGPEAEDFGQAIAALAGRKYGAAVSSGTDALRLALRVCNLGLLDRPTGEPIEVLLPPFSFAATLNVLLHEGIRPVFADVDPVSWTLDPAAVADAMTPATRGILAVDMLGVPSRLSELERLASARGAALIEDACEALGATRDGRAAGSAGRCAAFAFYPNKQVTAGEGGVLATDDPAADALVRSLRNQGRENAGRGPGFERPGYNDRLDEMSAALGNAQLARFGEILRGRAEVASMYRERLADLVERKGIELPIEEAGVVRSWFLFFVRLPEEADRDRVIESMERAGVPARAYFPPLHRLPYLSEEARALEGAFPVAESVCRRILALPFFNGMTPSQIDRASDALRAALDGSGT